MNKINLNKIVWTLILAMLFMLIYNLIATNNIKNYLKPSMVKYVYFAAAFILILTIFELFNLNGEGAEPLKKGYLLFLLPIIIYVLLKSQPINEGMTLARGVNMNFYSQRGEYNLEHNHENDKKAELIINANRIELNEDNFYDGIKEIYKEPEKYSTYTLAIKGYVISTDNNTFVLGRTVISCCAADAEIIGIRCYYKDGDKIKEGSWVKLEGSIIRDMNTGEPFIRVENANMLPEPSNTYIYRD